MNDIVINIFITLVIIVFIIIIKKIYNKHKKNYNVLIDFLSRNIEILAYHEKNDYVNMMRKSSKLFSYCQSILKTVSCDYMTFFKYDYSRGYISLDFLFTMNKEGTLIDNSLLDNLPVTSTIMCTKVLRSDNQLNFLYIDDIKESEELYCAFKERNIYKIYYKNLYNDKGDGTLDCLSERLGFFFIAYTDDYIMSEDDKDDVTNTIKKMKKLI